MVAEQNSNLPMLRTKAASGSHHLPTEVFPVRLVVRRVLAAGRLAVLVALRCDQAGRFWSGVAARWECAVKRRAGRWVMGIRLKRLGNQANQLLGKVPAEVGRCSLLAAP